MAPATARDERASIEIRAGDRSDLAFVYATWLRSMKFNSRLAKRVSHDVWFALHHEVIQKLFARGAQLAVAHPAGDPGVIVGYIVTEPSPEGTRIAGLDVPSPAVLHWLYVKGPFRRMGIARALLEHARVSERTAFTHLTDAGEKLWELYPEASYWPHLAF